jgi:hypothetical protein
MSSGHSVLPLVQRWGVGPQPDLVDHHRTHGDGVAARPGPLRVELLGHRPRFLEVSDHPVDEFVDLR